MGLKRLTLETIKDLDSGIAMETFSIAVQRAVKDCLDRPGDKRARKVMLSLNITPKAVVTNNTIDCEGARGIFQCKVKIPDWETREVDFGVQQDGNLIFNPDSPTDHRQMTLIDDPD